MLLLFVCIAPSVCVGDSSADQRKAAIVAKADKLFEARYTPPKDKSLRLFDKERETGPADEIIYRHGASYVIRIVFADDGTLARVQLLPKALLHVDNWRDVPAEVQLSPSEMKWLLQSTDNLQKLGEPKQLTQPPSGCFQSGQNLYCTDFYEHASVNHFNLERMKQDRSPKALLKQVTIAYKQVVSGMVEDIKVEDDQHQIRVGRNWYGQKSDIFKDVHKESFVQFESLGCTANVKVCIANRPEVK
ncbi:MAG: hypothetical protein JWO13_3275 [Acidobacteriales bacterium]|nr:hypothetical protein [Terriglobales bacterium]